MDEPNFVELCGCTLNPDGRLVQPCAECAKAALRERTEGALSADNRYIALIFSRQSRREGPSWLSRFFDSIPRLPRCL